MKKTTILGLKVGAAPMVLSIALASGPAFAQAASSAPSADEGSAIIVTGSRIARPNLTSSSPIAVVTGEQIVANADVTLDTYLNTLPQVNPAGTTTSNNPGNGGQSNINLRGLGSNRNIVLIDGKRPMVSASDQTVDLNTIPQALIERIDVTTGGGGATYGADAIAGVVNIILKKNFEGLDLRATYSNAVPGVDAKEYQFSGVIGGNFADGKGNISLAVDYSNRQGLIKAQRPFAATATSTTGTPPVGRFVESSGNPITQAALTSVFSKYGVSAGQTPTPGSGLLNFNSDGTLFSAGSFNSPLDVANYRYAANGSDAAGANQNFFPDFYSYNFDAINLLVLPLERKSAFVRANYQIAPAIEVFLRGGYTEYDAASALAPTPIGTRIVNPATPHNATVGTSSLVVVGKTNISNPIIPVTNPFIPTDLATLLASRTGDDASLVGSGATEPFRLAIRSLSTGLRKENFNNQVLQGLIGVRGDISPNWSYEAYYSYGRTKIDDRQTGNVDVNKLQSLLEAADGGKSLCAGGYNPFGIQTISAACSSYIAAVTEVKTEFTQHIAQANVTGTLFKLPGGDVKVNVGVESRKFRYRLDPGAAGGAIAGFGTQSPAAGTNSFLDFFGEVYAPITDAIDLTLGYRRSTSDFNDVQHGIKGDKVGSDAYKAEISWKATDYLKLRASYQRSVRAPNFGELFSGGNSFVQIFDPCSVNTAFRQNGGASARALCVATGVTNASADSFVASPGLQNGLGFAGNPKLKPESADTMTAGVVFNIGRLTGSLDYYNIKIKDSIFGTDANMFIAACYGYLGNFNPTKVATGDYCQAVFRSGSAFAGILVPPGLGGDANSNQLLTNTGKIKTSGLDLQLNYKLPTEFVNGTSSMNLNLFVNYLIDYKVEELPGVTLNYAGTASYFGEGLGTSFPRWKATLNADWKLTSGITWSNRFRYIPSMGNRASLQFPGEKFTGPGSIFYMDTAVQFDVGPMMFRVGANNLFNKKPPAYTPNVQSGTDPSLYDVIGRRLYVSGRLKF